MQVVEQIGLYGSTFIVVGTTDKNAPTFDTKQKALIYLQSIETDKYLAHLHSLINNLSLSVKYKDGLPAMQIRSICSVLYNFHKRAIGLRIVRLSSLANQLTIYGILLQLDKLEIILSSTENKEIAELLSFKDKTIKMLTHYNHN